MGESMLRTAKTAPLTCFCLLLAFAAHAQTGSPKSSPRLLVPTLGPYGDQERGIWVTRYGGGAPMFDVDSYEFKPWAQGLYDARQKHDLEPHARCKASGAIRQFLTPYGVEIVEIEALQRLYIFDIGGPHTYREVFMDGRSHPAELLPTNYGHNIGWWDDGTLVIDSVGYNEDFWYERAGLPHTEAAHVMEYFRRTDPETIEYTFVLDDPITYDAPIEAHLTMQWHEGEELFEYVCQQSNYAQDLMVNPEDLKAIGRTSDIVP
jgi:hypothetical protein